MSNVVPAVKARPAGRRAVGAIHAAEERICWPHFVQVNATRLKLKPDVSRTLYAVLSLLADEFDAQRTRLTTRGPEITDGDVGQMLFAKHAASAYRMAADRLLKSFTLTDMIRAERYGMEEWAAAVERMNAPGQKPGT